jgi:tripartite-type tricarboxylate transporter receptor subunit TctC
MRMDRRRLILALLAATGTPRLTPVLAQGWPSRTTRIVVPFPAGGSADLSARLLAEHFKAKLGQSVVVENCDGFTTRRWGACHIIPIVAKSAAVS